MKVHHRFIILPEQGAEAQDLSGIVKIDTQGSGGITAFSGPVTMPAERIPPRSMMVPTLTFSRVARVLIYLRRSSPSSNLSKKSGQMNLVDISYVFPYD
jgi:hypothetical protein